MQRGCTTTASNEVINKYRGREPENIDRKYPKGKGHEEEYCRAFQGKICRTAEEKIQKNT